MKNTLAIMGNKGLKFAVEFTQLPTACIMAAQEQVASFFPASLLPHLLGDATHQPLDHPKAPSVIPTFSS